MDIHKNKRNCLDKKLTQLPHDWFGLPTWMSFHRVKTLKWLSQFHVKMLYGGLYIAESVIN